MLRSLRTLVRAFRVFAIALLAIHVAACGKGGSSIDPGMAQMEVKNRLAALIECGIKDDLAGATPFLALQEYAVTLSQGKPQNVNAMPPAERAELTKACFAQLRSLTSQTTIKDTAAINASLGGAAFKVLPKLSRGEVVFFAIRDDKKAIQTQWKATFFRHGDGQWRMATIEEQFDR